MTRHDSADTADGDPRDRTTSDRPTSADGDGRRGGLGVQRRSFLGAVGAGSVLAGISGEGAARVLGQHDGADGDESGDDRPNVLWLSMEDVSLRFGAYGDDVARTPNMDQLAADGARYDNACMTAGVCSPARASIITGMYQNAIGAEHMRTSHTGPTVAQQPTPYRTVPPHYVRTFTEYLRADGYYCTNSGKTDYQFSGVETAPVTNWDENGPTAHWRNRDGDQPFFSVFNFADTHETNMSAATNAGSEPETDPSRVEVPPYLPDTDPVRRSIAHHYDNIAAVDQQVGQRLRELEDAGLADDTVVFLWTDHGDGLPRAKRSLYDSGIQVPLIVRWPGEIGPETVREEPVSGVDFGPTVLSITGTDIPNHMQGKPFLGPDATERDFVFAARDRLDEHYDMVRAVRGEVDGTRYKYIRSDYPEQSPLGWVLFRSNVSPTMRELLRRRAEGSSERSPSERALLAGSRPPEELYDLDADPHETENLAVDATGEDREALEELRAFVAETMDFEAALEERARDKARKDEQFALDAPELTSGNAYLLPDGRVVDADTPVYDPRVVTADPAELFGDWPGEDD